MVDILDAAISSAVAVIIIFFWVLPEKILPALSEINESETLLITPFQSYIVGVLLIIGVFCLFLSKR
jgi:hypothetical protein